MSALRRKTRIIIMHTNGPLDTYVFNCRHANGYTHDIILCIGYIRFVTPEMLSINHNQLYIYLSMCFLKHYT